MINPKGKCFSLRLLWLSLPVLIIFLTVWPVSNSNAATVQMPADIKKHWAAEQITEWIERGLVSCYPDGYFRPEEKITRAQFISMVNNVLGLKEKAPISFSDVQEGDWFYAEVAKAKKSGYISGFPDNTIRPSSMITRQEMAVILTKIMGLEPYTAGVNRFKDSATVSSWSRGSFGVVVAQGIIIGFPDGTCRPTNTATRAEALVMLNKAMVDSNGDPLTEINDEFIVSADRAISWHQFKDQGGPTFSGSPSWHRFLNFLENELSQCGVIDITKNKWSYNRWYTSDSPGDNWGDWYRMGKQ